MRPAVLAYLAADLLSLLGNSIAAVALPLIVLQTTGSPLGAGTVAAATAVPAVLVGLFAGVLIDRVNRRTASVVSDVLSAAAMAALPLVDLVWGLDLGWFILLGVLGSFGDVPGMTAREVLVPAVARHAGMPLERLVGVREALGSATLLLGPAAAGTLMVLLDGSTVLWITAATSALAAVATLLIPHRVGHVDSATTTRREPVRTQLAAGFGAIWHNPLLRGLSVLTVGVVLAIAALQGLVLPLYFTVVGLPGLLGFVLSALGAGTLLGAVVYTVVGYRLSRRASLTIGLVGTTIGFVVIGALAAPWSVLLGAFLMGLASGQLNAVLGVATVEATPDAVRGRVLSVQNALVTAAAPAGIALAGVIAEYGSVGAAGWATTATWVLAVGVVLACRSLRGVSEPIRQDPVHHDQVHRDREVARDAQR